MRHAITVHEGKFSCTICGFKASREDALADHIKSKHKDTKYRCNVCDKEFSGHSAVWQHTKECS